MSKCPYQYRGRQTQPRVGLGLLLLFTPHAHVSMRPRCFWVLPFSPLYLLFYIILYYAEGISLYLSLAYYHTFLALGAIAASDPESIWLQFCRIRLKSTRFLWISDRLSFLRSKQLENLAF